MPRFECGAFNLSATLPDTTTTLPEKGIWSLAFFAFFSKNWYILLHGLIV
jgi:hypothetical protein